MYRGTTPTISYKVENLSDFTTIKDIWITIKDRDKILINKTYKNGEVTIDTENKVFSIDLTQKETLSFVSPEVATQIKIGFADGRVSVSPVFFIKISDILNPAEMTITSSSTEESDTDAETE